MFETASQITEVIKEKETYFKQLRTRMDDDFNLLTLKEFKAKDPKGRERSGYQTYTSNAPRTFFDKVVDGLNRAIMTIQIKLPEDAKEEDRRSASLGELFIFGALNSIDRWLVNAGEPPLREGIGFYICARGWYGMRALVYVPEGEKETIFDVQPWDPMHMTWEQGRKGLLWAAHKRVATKAQIEEEYGDDVALHVKGKAARITDFWDAERNSVLIDDRFVKDPTEHGIEHVPVFIGAVGAMPTMQPKSMSESASTAGTTASQAILANRGDSVWTSNRDTYEPRNKYISWVMDTAARAVAGSLVHKSKGAKKKISDDPYATFQVIALDTDQDEALDVLKLPESSPETAAILGIIEGDQQQGALPYPLAYGGTREALSGRALAMLADATRSVYSPRTGALAQAYSWLCRELLWQFSMKGVKPALMEGFLESDEFFSQTIKPKEIKSDWFVSVRVEPKMPRDEAEEIAMAQMATQKAGPEDQPLLSKGTARESILKLRDPDAEQDKVLAEMGRALPPIMAASIAAALKRRGEDELAEQVAALLRQPAQGQPGAGPGAGAPAGGVVPTNGAQPGQQPEVPPEVQVFQAVLQALGQTGAMELAQALAQVLDSGQPIPPQLVEAVVQVLVQSGQQQLAEAFLAAVADMQQQPRPAPAPAGEPTPAAPLPTDDERLSAINLVRR